MPRYTVGWKRSPPLYGPIALDISTRCPRFTRTSPRSSTQETRNEMTRSGSTNRSSTLASRYSGCRSRHSSSDPAASRTACRNSGSFVFLAVTSAIRRRTYSPTRYAPPTGSHRDRRCVILTRAGPRPEAPPTAGGCLAAHHASANARRRASAKGTGSISGKRRRAPSSRTTMGVVMPSINGRASERRDRRGEAAPVRGEPRGQQRHTDDQGVAATLGRDRLDHAAIGGDVGPADLDDRAALLERGLEPGDEVGEHVVDGDRLRGRVDPSRHDHRRQPVHEIGEHRERRAVGAHDHGRAELEQRRPRLGEDAPGLVPALEVLGELALVVAEAAEVDHAFHARGQRRPRRRPARRRRRAPGSRPRPPVPSSAPGSRRPSRPRAPARASRGAARRPRPRRGRASDRAGSRAGARPRGARARRPPAARRGVRRWRRWRPSRGSSCPRRYDFAAEAYGATGRRRRARAVRGT